MKGSPRLVAVGDLHGELEGFLQILRTENLIDSRSHWSGAETILLQMGDIIDRGPHSREACYAIRALQKEAVKSGGRLIRLFGNHELLALQGNYYYCDFKDPALLAEEIRKDIIEGKIQTAFVWKGRLFVHAGIRLGILEKIAEELGIKTKVWDPYYDKIADHMNETVRECVRNDDYSHPFFWIDISRGGRDEVGGIFWSHYPDLEREWINPIRQVVGHTPLVQQAKQGIRWTKDGNKINIDAGLTYCGNQAWLVVEGERWIARNLLKGQVREQVIE